MTENPASKFYAVCPIIFHVFFGLSGWAQSPSSWTEVDTIQEFQGKYLVEYRMYQDSLLMEKAQAFFYPRIIEVPRFRFFQSIFTREAHVDSLVYHGEKKTFLKNRAYEISIYHKGEIQSSQYFNGEGAEISRNQYNQSKQVIGPCLKTGSYFFINGGPAGTDL